MDLKWIQEYIECKIKLSFILVLNLNAVQGAQLAEQIHAQQLLDKYAEKLIENVETTQPKSAYDIQSQSMHVAKQQLIYLLNEQDLNLIKQKAFQNGLLLEDFFSIFGVLLRDKILALKGIQVSQVDQPEFR